MCTGLCVGPSPFLDLWEHVTPFYVGTRDPPFMWEHVRASALEGHFLWEHGRAPFYVGTRDPLSEHAHWMVCWTPTYPGPVGTHVPQCVGPSLRTSYMHMHIGSSA